MSRESLSVNSEGDLIVTFLNQSPFYHTAEWGTINLTAMLRRIVREEIDRAKGDK